jgi:hypothetical protein
MGHASREELCLRKELRQHFVWAGYVYGRQEVTGVGAFSVSRTRAANVPFSRMKGKAFPLTAIYAARALPGASGSTRTVLADHLRQQHQHLTHIGEDFEQALGLIDNGDLRDRLIAVYRTARDL